MEYEKYPKWLFQVGGGGGEVKVHVVVHGVTVDDDDVDGHDDGDCSSSFLLPLRRPWSPERLQREPSSLPTSSTGM